MQIVSKNEAKLLGLKRYFTGSPCRRGHIVERLATTNDCIECLKDRQARWNTANAERINARSQQWYAANKEQAKATRADWRARNAEKDRADIAAYQAENRDRLKIAASIWSKRNSVKRNAYAAKHRSEHKEKVLAQGAQWRRLNRDKVNAKKSRRIAAKLLATPLWADSEMIREIYKLASQTSADTGLPYHVDHIVPLKSKWVCGLHCEANLQILPGLENQSKSNCWWPDMPIHLLQGRP